MRVQQPTRFARIPRATVAALLTKLGKHIALLVSLLILDNAFERFQVSQTFIASLVIIAALFHSTGRTLQRSGGRNALPWGRSR